MGDEILMGENKRSKSIKWAELNSYKKRFIESMGDNLARTWLWMYFSGLSADEIANEYSVSKTRVFVSLKNNIEKYNQFYREEKEKEKAAAAQKSTTDVPKQGTIKQKDRAVRETSGKNCSKPAAYRPKKQSLRIYRKLKKRIDAQFDKKFYIGDIPVSQEELLEYTRC